MGQNGVEPEVEALAVPDVRGASDGMARGELICLALRRRRRHQLSRPVTPQVAGDLTTTDESKVTLFGRSFDPRRPSGDLQQSSLVDRS